jgi:hypothetical protein
MPVSRFSFASISIPMASVAEDGVATLQVLDESLDLLVLKLDLLRPLRDGDRLVPGRADERDVVGVRRLHERAGEFRRGVFRAAELFPRPVGAGEIAEVSTSVGMRGPIVSAGAGPQSVT